MKPIAYFAKDSDGWWAETDKETGIPLYTAPRELSDEEIDVIHKKLIDVLEHWNVSTWVDAEDGEPFPLLDLISQEGGTIESGKYEIECIADELISVIFKQSILKKASEK